MPPNRTPAALTITMGAVRTVAIGRDTSPSWLAGCPVGLRRLTVIAVTVLTLVGYPLCAALAAHSHPMAPAWAGLIALGEIAPLALVVRYPLLGWRLGYVAALLAPLAPGDPWGSWPWDPPQIPLLVLAYTVAGLRFGRGPLWTMWALTVGALWLWSPDPSDSLGGTVAFTVFTALLDALASQRSARRALAEETERADAERARRAVLEDRARIARELHDVVAHQMSLIAVHAETAPYRHDALPEPVRADLALIGGMAREALTEMRRLLGALRGADSPDPTAPQPGLTDLTELVETARRAGLAIDLHLDDVGPVPATVGLCAYRVVQESLSNAARHAPSSPVTVTLARSSHELTVMVHSGSTSVRLGPPGHGIAGMRERVALLGGSLRAGADRDGAFTVAAALPLDGPA